MPKSSRRKKEKNQDMSGSNDLTYSGWLRLYDHSVYFVQTPYKYYDPRITAWMKKKYYKAYRPQTSWKSASTSARPLK